jgi:hypothetical protein
MGAGSLFYVPSSGQRYTTTATKPVFVYGLGVDWRLPPHIGLRFQYRDNVFHSPYLATEVSSTSALTHTAEPMIGVYFRL